MASVFVQKKIDENPRAYILSLIFVKFFHQFWYEFVGKFLVTNFGDFLIEIFSDSLKFSPKLVTKKNKFGRNYCHQNWWYFRHSKTHQFHQITKIFTKIGDKKPPKLEGIIVTRIGDIFVTQKLTNFFNSPKMSPKLVKNLAKIQ